MEKIKILAVCYIFAMAVLACNLETYNEDDNHPNRHSNYTESANKNRLATPVIEPPGGFFPGPVSVTIYASIPMAEIRYTLDNTEPNCNSSLIYSEALILNTSVILKAIHCKPGFRQSQISAAFFLISGTIAYESTGASFLIYPCTTTALSCCWTETSTDDPALSEDDDSVYLEAEEQAEDDANYNEEDSDYNDYSNDDDYDDDDNYSSDDE